MIRETRVKSIFRFRPPVGLLLVASLMFCLCNCDNRKDGHDGVTRAGQKQASGKDGVMEGGDGEHISKGRRARSAKVDESTGQLIEVQDETAVVTKANKLFRLLGPESTVSDFDALRNVFPPYEDATPALKEKMAGMAIVVCANENLPIKQRIDFAWKMLPDEIYPNAVDDAIRFANADDLVMVDKWLRERPAGWSRTKLFRLVVGRMKRLGMKREDIEEWISTLEYPRERSSTTSTLNNCL